MFADDTFCAKSDSNLDTLMWYINGKINKMAVWFRANKLAVNVNKTKYMIFHTVGKNFLKILPIWYTMRMNQMTFQTQF
jgi:hypothetical protein